MGTRSLTVFFEPEASGEDWRTKEPWHRPEAEIVVMYRQYDGYVDGHGHDLARFLGDGEVTNGISGTPSFGTSFNGMSCLAAQVVAHFKTDVGGFYLYPAGTRDAGEEYVYEIRQKDGKPHITVIAYEETIFKGSAEELAVFTEHP